MRISTIDEAIALNSPPFIAILTSKAARPSLSARAFL
jgi:hypothetical protein